MGYALGGLLIDNVLEPMMAAQQPASAFSAVFGTGKGSGAAVLFFLLGLLGVITCLIFRKDANIWALEKSPTSSEEEADTVQ